MTINFTHFSNMYFLLILILSLQKYYTHGFTHFTVNRATRSQTCRIEVSMNMFSRMARVVTSNVNQVIKNLEDPEKVLEQTVIDMQNDLVKVRQSYAEIVATLKKMEKQNSEATKNADEWYRRAQLALEKGDEELAREALSRRQVQTDLADGLKSQLDMQQTSMDKLYSSMTSLESKISTAKREKEMLIAKARTAKTSIKVNDMLSNVGDSSTEAFDRMKQKVDSLETQAEVAGELAATTSGTTLDLEDRFKALEGDNKIEDELEMMKKQLPGTAKSDNPIAELPAKTDLDVEYERLKKELGK